MKTLSILATLAAASAIASAQDYTNFIRQVQIRNGLDDVRWDVPVGVTGVDVLSPLPINDSGGARFELWTVKSSPATNYLLDTKYVSTYSPQATVTIITEDPYKTIPRTRADRSFSVKVSVKGLDLVDPNAPVAAKSVNFYRHVQSYGPGGTGVNLNRDNATLLSTASINQIYLPATEGGNPLTLSYGLTSIPGSDRTKIRGEERFSVFSLPDYQAPATQLASQFVQIWPVADGLITGITEGQLVRFKLPQVTLTLNDLYPSSTTFARIYQTGKTPLIVPGSSLLLNETVPQNRVLTLSNWDSIFDADGDWTLELVTMAPFDTAPILLGKVSFKLDRTIQLNANVITLD